jgi:hypothetical protein
VPNVFLLDGCIASIAIELDANASKELQMKINKQAKSIIKHATNNTKKI